MKISELMEKLAEAKEKHGDISVVLFDYYAETDDSFSLVKKVIFSEESIYWDEGDCVNRSGWRIPDWKFHRRINK